MARPGGWAASAVDRRAGSRFSRAPEPARPALCTELLLLGCVLERGVITLGRRRLAAQEADLDLADQPAAELGVADARTLIRRGRIGARDRCGDVLGDHAGRRLGKDPGLRNGPRTGTDVATRIDPGEAGPEVRLLDGHPVFGREARLRERSGSLVDRDPDEEVVGQGLAARELRGAGRRVDPGDESLGQFLD